MPEFSVYDPPEVTSLAVQPAGAGSLSVPVDPSAASTPPSTPDFNGMRYIEPTLNAAQPGKYATPYYSAYTNSGDLAAATYAGEGQGVRLIDPKTGSVLYSGTGPEAAKYATGLANALSQDKGRKAAWAIQVGNGDQWTTTGYDRKDPKHSLLGAVADIALPALGAILLPGVGGVLAGALGAGLGAAGGSAVSSIAQGRGVGSTLTRAALSGLGAGVLGPGLNNAIAGLPGGAAAGASGAAGALGSSASNFTAAELAGAISPLVVNGGSSVLGSAAGGALGGAGGALLGGSGGDTLQPPPGGANPPPTDIEGLTVTAQQMAERGMSLADLLKVGIPLGVATAALTNLGVSNLPSAQPAPAPGNVEGLTPTPQPNAVPDGLMEAIKNNQVGQWIAANPLSAAQLGLLAAGAVGSLVSGPPKGSSGGAGGNANAGTRESLSVGFNRPLPAPSLAVRQPRDMSGIDWAHYGEHPEQSFFTSVPRPGFAVGGPVAGPGGGRDDAIDAKLSDGEYVMDAETVSMLGDGSNRAGADALDSFRVNLRRHKGGEMAKGQFSVRAKAPQFYVTGAR